MRKFRPLVTSPNEIVVTREKQVTIIQYKNPAYATMHLGIGPEPEESRSSCA